VTDVKTFLLNINGAAMTLPTTTSQCEHRMHTPMPPEVDPESPPAPAVDPDPPPREDDPAREWPAKPEGDPPIKPPPVSAF
jgi:hypothetical protein